MKRPNRKPTDHTARIKELRGYAADDGIEVNESSVRNFLAFTSRPEELGPASIVLLDNGNLRGLWTVGNTRHHLEFHGENIGSLHIDSPSDHRIMTKPLIELWHEMLNHKP